MFDKFKTAGGRAVNSYQCQKYKTILMQMKTQNGLYKKSIFCKLY